MANISKLRPFDKIEIIRKTSGLSSTQKLILLTIATHLGVAEFAYLSLSTLQKECCIKKRTALSHNLQSLIMVDIIWFLPPSDGFVCNRYGINFKKLVTNGHYAGDPRLPDRSPTVTKVVTNGHPKRKLNKIKKIKEELSLDKSMKEKAEEAKIQLKEYVKKTRKTGI